MTDLAAVADKLEIIEVCTRTHWCYDHEAWDGLAASFADTVSMPTVAQVTGDPDFDAGTYLGRYLFTREEVTRALRSVKQGLVTQHLIAGHQVRLDGDRAVCLAHSINVHLPAGPASGAGLLAHGNEYRFDLIRTAGGWRIRGWIPRVRWSYGDDSVHDVAAKQRAWLPSKNT
jgi:hypothetical protein